MSAPPIGRISRKPSASETAKISQNAVGFWSASSQPISTNTAMPRAAFSGCCIGNTSGRPVTRPCSLPNATIEPVKVMAPIASPIDISISDAVAIAPGWPMP